MNDRSGKQFSILVVDDSPMNIQVLNDILHTDYRVVFATNGEDALEVAVEEVPDLILLDVMMPEMDGYEVCRRLKQNPLTADIPVIFVTALTERDDEAKGLELGAIDYITKPVNRAVVKARVRNHLELKSYRDLLKNLALIDGLTGIANRRAFDEQLDREWKRAIRNNRAISLILLDVDYFKRYNDRYGHAEGDECLRRVASALRDGVSRPADLAARYGGEEFVALLPETEADGAMHTAERIRQAVEALAVPHAESAAADHVTISLGIASVLPSDGQEAASLILAADQALYRAKEQGRNRAVAG